MFLLSVAATTHALRRGGSSSPTRPPEAQTSDGRYTVGYVLVAVSIVLLAVAAGAAFLV